MTTTVRAARQRDSAAGWHSGKGTVSMDQRMAAPTSSRSPVATILPVAPLPSEWPLLRAMLPDSAIKHPAHTMPGSESPACDKTISPRRLRSTSHVQMTHVRSHIPDKLATIGVKMALSRIRKAPREAVVFSKPSCKQCSALVRVSEPSAITSALTLEAKRTTVQAVGEEGPQTELCACQPHIPCLCIESRADAADGRKAQRPADRSAVKARMARLIFTLKTKRARARLIRHPRLLLSFATSAPPSGQP